MQKGQRDAILLRANNRCEYCHLPQAALDLTFHVDHVVARQHGGETESENLCVACDRCNLKKGPNLASIDPVSGELVPLFNPRSDHWSTHFSRVETEIVGTTAVGRATAALLEFNASRRRDLRAGLIAEGVIPASE